MIVTLLSAVFIWFIVVAPLFSDVRREVLAVGFFGGLTCLHFSLFWEGDDFGVRALSEAIRRRSGKEEVTFYTPSFGGVTIRSGSEIVEAEDRLLELAKAHRLMEDPAATQNLISAANTVLGSDGMGKLVQMIFAFAGSEQGYDFQ